MILTRDEEMFIEVGSIPPTLLGWVSHLRDAFLVAGSGAIGVLIKSLFDRRRLLAESSAIEKKSVLDFAGQLQTRLQTVENQLDALQQQYNKQVAELTRCKVEREALINKLKSLEIK